MASSLARVNCVEIAAADAFATLDAFRVVYRMQPFRFTLNRIDGAGFGTKSATDALLRIDMEFDKSRTYACRAAPIVDVLLVLGKVVANSGESRIGS